MGSTNGSEDCRCVKVVARMGGGNRGGDTQYVCLCLKWWCSVFCTCVFEYVYCVSTVCVVCMCTQRPKQRLVCLCCGSCMCVDVKQR